MVQNKVFSVIIFIVLALSASANMSDECKALQSKYKSFRKLDPTEVSEYCDNECKFMRRLNCDIVYEFTSFKLSDILDITKWKKVITDGSADTPVNWLKINISTATYASILQYLIPYLLAIVPIILQWVFLGPGSSRDNPSRSGLLLINFVLASAFIFRYGWKTVASLNYLAYAYLSAFSVVGQRVFQDLICMYLMLMLLVGGSLSTSDLYALTLLGVCIAAGLVAQVYTIVGRRSYSDRVSLVTAICNLLVVSDYLSFLLNQFAMENAAIAIVRLAIYAILPAGDSVSLLDNCVREAAFVATYFEKAKDEIEIGIFFACLISYLSIFLLSRAMIGGIVLSSLKFDWSVNMVSVGFYAYSVDLINPIRMISYHVLSLRENAVRRVMYGLLMILLLFFEFFHAREYIFLRAVLFCLEVTIFNTGLVDSSRFLDMPFNLAGIAFPKPGAFPFASLGDLVAIREATKRLTTVVNTQSGAEMRSGAGLLHSSSNGSRLISVRHVLMDKHGVKFCSQNRQCEEAMRTLDTIGASVDPAVSMKLMVKYDDATDVKFLSGDEVKLVRYLFMISPEDMIVPITDFRFDDNGDIHATVNVMQGDSGSPIIGILTNGVCRFAGTVSRGDSRSGHSNLFSSVASKRRFAGSPGTSEPYLEVANIRTEADLRILKSITDMLKENRERFIDRFPEPDDYGGERWDPDSAIRHGSKRRVKSYKKDRAAQKRAYSTLVNNSLLNEEQREEALNAFDDCRVIEFNFQRARRTLAPRFVPEA